MSVKSDLPGIIEKNFEQNLMDSQEVHYSWTRRTVLFLSWTLNWTLHNKQRLLLTMPGCVCDLWVRTGVNDLPFSVMLRKWTPHHCWLTRRPRVSHSTSLKEQTEERIFLSSGNLKTCRKRLIFYRCLISWGGNPFTAKPPAFNNNVSSLDSTLSFTSGLHLHVQRAHCLWD